MSTPVRHHYVPVCYLKAWSTSGLLWLYYKHEDGRVIGGERPPRRVGFEKHLNTLHGSETPSALEDYLAGIDDKAAPVLDSMRSGATPSDHQANERRAFAKFIVSLLERHPDRVRLREDIAAQRLEELRASPKMGPMITSLPVSLVEKHLDPLIAGRVGLKQIIEDPNWIDHFISWQWVTGGFDENPLVSPLVTSDRPVICIKDNDDEYIYTIAMAISPTQVFIAHPHSLEMKPSDYVDLVGLHNVRIVAGAPGSVFSSTPLHDDSLQVGGFTLHFQKAMDMYLQVANWRRSSPEDVASRPLNGLRDDA